MQTPEGIKFAEKIVQSRKEHINLIHKIMKRPCSKCGSKLSLKYSPHSEMHYPFCSQCEEKNYRNSKMKKPKYIEFLF